MVPSSSDPSPPRPGGRPPLLLEHARHAALEARRPIDLEHLFYAVVADGRSATAAALAGRGITAEGVLEIVLEIGGRGSIGDTGPQRPFTPAARDALVRATDVAHWLGAEHPGPDHVALAAVAARGGNLAELLRRLRIDPFAVRGVVLAAHGHGADDEETAEDDDVFVSDYEDENRDQG